MAEPTQQSGLYTISSSVKERYTARKRPGGSGAINHGGKYFGMQTVQNTQVDFTGSNDGTWGAVMTGHSSAAGTITLSGGGSMPIGSLTTQVIYDLSILQISENGNQPVFAFKKQQIMGTSPVDKEYLVSVGSGSSKGNRPIHHDDDVEFDEDR